MKILKAGNTSLRAGEAFDYKVVAIDVITDDTPGAFRTITFENVPGEYIVTRRVAIPAAKEPEAKSKYGSLYYECPRCKGPAAYSHHVCIDYSPAPKEPVEEDNEDYHCVIEVQGLEPMNIELNPGDLVYRKREPEPKLPADVEKAIRNAHHKWQNEDSCFEDYLLDTALAILTECRRIAKEECGR